MCKTVVNQLSVSQGRAGVSRERGRSPITARWFFHPSERRILLVSYSLLPWMGPIFISVLYQHAHHHQLKKTPHGASVPKLHISPSLSSSHFPPPPFVLPNTRGEPPRPKKTIRGSVTYMNGWDSRVCIQIYGKLASRGGWRDGFWKGLDM